MNRAEKSIITLELPAVLERLAEDAVSQPGKEMVRTLTPSANAEQVRMLQHETSAAKTLIGIKGNPPLYGVREVAGALARADIGGMLNTRELLEIASVLKAARLTRRYADDKTETERGTTDIDYLFRLLQGNKFLEEQITIAIAGEGELADAASSELARIRRKKRQTAAKTQETLRKIITSPTYAKALQEAIITQRSGRYVVPVKAEYKGAVQGLVHDTSSSGATLFIEPNSVVTANNELRELDALEETEIERVLMELSAAAANKREDITSDFDLLVRLDTIFARAKFSSRQKATAPEICGNSEVQLRQARHPLLDPQTAVPIDIHLGGSFDTLVITGPNTGGKTVSLKTLGLLCLMAQCGLHIPADEGSSLPVFGQILADIGDEQSIEQSLSTFSSHMTNIVDILAICDKDSLLLFDELGAGTDPVEGAALAISIIEHARHRGAKVAATTHYAELKVFATTTAGVINAACEFDVQTLRPTYRLLIGIPGKSNAFAIAGRLGLAGSVIEDAKRRIDADSADFEQVLTQLDEKRRRMEEDELKTQELLASARADHAAAKRLRHEIESAHKKARETAKREADGIVQDARRMADDVFHELKQLRKSQSNSGGHQAANDVRSALYQKLNQAEDSLLPTAADVPADTNTRPIVAGDTVELRNLGTRAEVISVTPDGVLNLQAGILKISAKLSEIRLVEGVAALKVHTPNSSPHTTPGASATAATEVDLRGMTAEEAVAETRQAIDRAALANLETITIIHGKGTGVLRRAVHETLKRNPLVKQYRLGRYGEGEDGVTIVSLQ